MKSQCWPFAQIPHTTPLFADFLAWSPKVHEFYPRSPRFAQWMEEEAPRVNYDSHRRERVSTILERQNRRWGVSQATLENIARLRAGSFAVVTGQQVGLFGGPLFSLFKALSAIKLAEDATRAGIDCVPVFWLATEDHDLAEVNQVAVPGREGNLHKFAAPVQGIEDAPVKAIRFAPGIEEVVNSFEALVGESEVTALLREFYRPEENFGDAFAKLFAHLYGQWGVILLDAGDVELHRIAEPVYRAAAERADELNAAVIKRGEALEHAGYHAQVKVTNSSTLLFQFREGARVPIHRHRGEGAEFVVGKEGLSASQLLREISAEPERFSANVLLRPVLQDYLLPSLAYTGGAAEIAYFAQAAVVYEAIGGRTTPIIPRYSATIIELKLQTLLERYSITLPDLWHGAEKLREVLGLQTLPEALQKSFDQAKANLDESLAAMKEALARLDKTLVDSATHAGEKMHHQLEQLRGRAARAELRQSELISRHADLLSNSLYPNNTLQEREIAAAYFCARLGSGFLPEIYKSIHSDCLDHQIVSY